MPLVRKISENSIYNICYKFIYLFICCKLHSLRQSGINSLSHILQLGKSGDDVGLDADVVGSAEDLEVAVFAPVGVPGVGHQPVGSVVFDAPTQDLDGVASHGLSSHVLVDT